MARLLKGLAAGLLVALAGALLLASPIGAGFERNAGLHWLFKLRGPIEPPEEVVVVAMDGRTGELLGLPTMPREWPRSIHARLVDALVERGASVIAFDVHFGIEKASVDDALFVDAVRRAGRVLMVELLTGKRRPLTDGQGRHVGMVWEEELVPPFPALANAAAGVAAFPLPKEGASVFQFWAFKESTNHSPTLPAMALQRHARSGAEPLLRLVEAVDPDRLTRMPALADAFNDGNQLRTLMRELRMAFNDNPVQLRAVDRVSALDPPILPEQALEALYGGDAHRFLNFYGPPGTIPNIPFHAVLRGEDPNVPPEALDFTGKVVFVGFSDLYDPGQPDRFYTVFTRDDGVDLSGVEIAATAFGNLLTNRALLPMDGPAALLMVLLFGLVLAMLVYLLPAYAGVPLSLGLTALYGLSAYRVFVDQATIIPVATPLLLQAPLALFIGLVGQYLLERKRGKRISEAINYYLPKDIARDLTRDRLDEAKLNRVVHSTCLATDMAGFSTIAEELPPGELASFLNDYFETLATALKRHGVQVTEFRADAIMCAWTSEDPADPEPRRKALLAALEAGDAIKAFQRRHGLSGARLRIGLEAGAVYVGHAGGGGRFVYSIVGDPANTASRVEGLNKHLGTEILATGAVVADFENLLTRYLGEFQFVGKNAGLPVHEVIALKENATEPQNRKCLLFEEAMTHFRASSWQKAEQGLERLLSEVPDDGPAAFFLERTRLMTTIPRAAIDPAVVKMEAK